MLQREAATMHEPLVDISNILKEKQTPPSSHHGLTILITGASRCVSVAFCTRCLFPFFSKKYERYLDSLTYLTLIIHIRIMVNTQWHRISRSKVICYE
jgi:hypothetical protein